MAKKSAKIYLLEIIKLGKHDLHYLWVPRNGGWWPAKVYHSGGDKSGWLSTDSCFRKERFSRNPKTYWQTDNHFGSYPKKWRNVSEAEVFAMLL